MFFVVQSYKFLKIIYFLTDLNNYKNLHFHEKNKDDIMSVGGLYLILKGGKLKVTATVLRLLR